MLRRSDYAYAGISPYCVTGELEKLVKLRVIKWDARRDLVWLNPDLRQWAVDRPGEKSGETLRRFFKIANKNLLKWQTAIYQNSKGKVAKTANNSRYPKEKKENIDKDYCNDNRFTKAASEYFLRVAPLSEGEASILTEIVRSHSPRLVEEAIAAAASGNSRSFSHFLKALDQGMERSKPVRRMAGMQSIGSAISRRRYSRAAS